MSIFNLRQCCKFTIPLASSIYSGIESIPFLCPNIWELVPFELIQKKLDASKFFMKN